MKGGKKWIRKSIIGLYSYIKLNIPPIFPLKIMAQSDAKGRFTYTHKKFFILFILSCVLLALRGPDRLLNAQFFAEDGTIFFKSAYELSFIDSLLQPFAGYYHLIPRIMAELASLSPLLTLPLVYSAVSLLIAALCMDFFYLPHFRHIVKSDALRLIFVIVLLVSPNQESLMKLSYIQWYLLLWCVMATFMTLPTNKYSGIIVIAGIMLSLWTAPVALIILPIWLIRLLITNNKKEQVFSGLVLSAGISSAIVLIMLNIGQKASGSTDFFTSVMPYINSVAVKSVVAPLLGANEVYVINYFINKYLGWPWSSSWELCALVIILVILLFLFVFVRQRALLTILFLYVAGSSLVAAYVLRISTSPDFLFNKASIMFAAGRYYYLSMVILYLLIFIIIDNWLIADGSTLFSKWMDKYKLTKHRMRIPAFLLSLIVALNLISMWTLPYVNYSWPDYCEEIMAAEKRVVSEGTIVIIIPINPPGWFIDLNVNSPYL